jgi:hypothetical protein
VIKADLMRVIQQFGNHHVSNLHWLNSANVALLPKKDGAEEISDFRPISLIHSIAKVITKMLAIRLGPSMNELISNAQSAFIKRRSIHDNFLYVQNMARRLLKNKTPSLLFKLDIRKAFDSIRWDYLIDLLQRRGFPSAFRNWITALFATSTSRVLLNGVADPPSPTVAVFNKGILSLPCFSTLALTRCNKCLTLPHPMAYSTKLGARALSCALPFTPTTRQFSLRP